MSDSLADLGTTSDIFRTKPDWSSDPVLSTTYGRDILQQGTRRAVIRHLTGNLCHLVQYAYANLNKSSEYTLSTFFNKMRGRANRFWLPVITQSFSLVTPIATNYSTVQVVENDVYSILQGYERFFIELTNGSLLTRKIVSAGSGGGPVCTIYLATVMDRNIALADVAYFGRLLLCRFDQDELELTYETDSLSSCSINFRELPFEYPENVV